MRTLKNVLRNWKKLLFGVLVLIITYQSWKIGYLEKQKVYVYQHSEFDDNNTKSEQDSSYESSGTDIVDDKIVDDKSELELDLELKNEEIEELKQEIEALKSIKNKASDKVLSDIFWDIGKYVPKDKITFFDSPSCDITIKPSFFFSRRWIFYDRKNEYEVYAYLSDVGYVYATSQVSFDEFKKTKKQ